MAEFATRGVGAAGLTTGIIGSALGALNSGVLGGGGIFGGLGNGACHENMPISRYESGMQEEISKLRSDIALRDANIYNDQKSLELYKYIDGELREIRAGLSAQAVMNQSTKDSFQLLQERLDCCKQEMCGAIARERDDRKCADNTLVNYMNATFYPKMVADVTTGTTTTAQGTYNPLPVSTCGCGC